MIQMSLYYSADQETEVDHREPLFHLGFDIVDSYTSWDYLEVTCCRKYHWNWPTTKWVIYSPCQGLVVSVLFYLTSII